MGLDHQQDCYTTVQAMIHYHGLPITPGTAAVEVISAGHAFLSFLHQQQVGMALEISQSFALDNGAFSAWSSGKPINDWRPYYNWVADIKRHPGFDFAVIPDVIDGDEWQNDELLAEWPHGPFVGSPVWHMHESFDRLVNLCKSWHRVCVGSSGEYSTVGDVKWWKRMSSAMDHICDEHGFPIAKIHGLRMLNPKVFQDLPLSSADSTNIGRNIGIDKRWKTGAYPPPTKEGRARLMRWRIEHTNGAQYWDTEL